MNQNDMDRYFWRTGQYWSGDSRAFKPSRNRRSLSHRAILCLLVAFAATVLYLLR
jgi:hypothetical protein